MKPCLSLLIVAALCAWTFTGHAEEAQKQETAKPAAEADQQTPARDAKLHELLTELKVKSADAKPQKHEVALPVASAGARAAQTRSVNRFAVLWPVESISPLHALAHNMNATYARSRDFKEIKRQLIRFVEGFPEFQDERLLKALRELSADPE